MNVRISRLSPHQNAKVFGILLALSSLLFLMPMALMISFMPSGMDAHGNPINPFSTVFFLILPFAYFVMGYIMVAVGCTFYNFMYKYIGGFEYESDEQQA